MKRIKKLQAIYFMKNNSCKKNDFLNNLRNCFLKSTHKSKGMRLHAHQTCLSYNNQQSKNIFFSIILVVFLFFLLRWIV